MTWCRVHRGRARPWSIVNSGKRHACAIWGENRRRSFGGHDAIRDTLRGACRHSRCGPHVGGCLPTTMPLAGADPADPGAKVAWGRLLLDDCALHQPSPDNAVVVARAERSRRPDAEAGSVGATDAPRPPLPKPLQEAPLDRVPAWRGSLRGSPAFRMRDVLSRRRHDSRRRRRRRNDQKDVVSIRTKEDAERAHQAVRRLLRQTLTVDSVRPGGPPQQPRTPGGVQ